ncbi:magnesium-dependent deoxyribonuclease, TatD family, and radical SAM domain iron-sulfur oxidoreductase [Geotalea daltonii FRC-32]|uniref:Magnesium-dependent deoxyribonuclease, TatD family, and radical SAM domain iron-sulfur oxidoreductase n=1 Tax=Geotalea daltonii (strain DSM 22248 / JCM 15807 / FRC-32) TaxID=316067 RepID=B9M4V4_GEODF|nr:magnesium-dependent deoxyribonuclease, TatD family, and radical SAM domain iron-sulfur oxidoreductase [Geotalea daltonii FRC-32]
MMPYNTLIDSHAHIYGPEFKDDFADMLKRAEEAGVSEIIVVGTDVATSRAACELATKYENLYCAVGIHPHDASGVTDKCYEEIRHMANSCTKVVAIGEIGLDFYRDRSPRHLQEEVFRRFIRLAREVSLPVIIHDRDAHDRVMAIVMEENAGAVGGVFHCFSGDLQMASRCIDLGFHISIPGTVTYPSNEGLRQVVQGTKIEKMLVETDCPYLTPVPHRGKRNEPAYVSITAARVAEIKGLSVEDVSRITTLNVRNLFNIGAKDQNARIAYRIRQSLYLNITNRCSNRCSFCAKFEDFTVKGHYLLLDHEPGFSEVMAAIAEHHGYEEVVFCGYGEPLLRLDLIKEIAAELKTRGIRTRINTDGQANLVYGRNILPELEGLIDCVSVSLNAADPETYDRLCHTPFGEAGFNGVCDFLREALKYIPQVVASAVTVPGLDIGQVRELAHSLGVEFREREFAEVG